MQATRTPDALYDALLAACADLCPVGTAALSLHRIYVPQVYQCGHGLTIEPIPVWALTAAFTTEAGTTTHSGSTPTEKADTGDPADLLTLLGMMWDAHRFESLLCEDGLDDDLDALAAHLQTTPETGQS